MERPATDATPISPELVTFTADEATLGVQALAYYIASSFPEMGGAGSWLAIRKTREEAAAYIENTARFVSSCQGLAVKLSETVQQPDVPAELSASEITILGSALFRLGNGGVRSAREALSSGTVGFSSESYRMIAAGEVEKVAVNTFNLFGRLEQIVTSKGSEHFVWMVWKAPLPLPEPGRS